MSNSREIVEEVGCHSRRGRIMHPLIYQHHIVIILLTPRHAQSLSLFRVTSFGIPIRGWRGHWHICSKTSCICATLTNSITSLCLEVLLAYVTQRRRDHVVNLYVRRICASPQRPASAIFLLQVILVNGCRVRGVCAFCQSVNMGKREMLPFQSLR